MMNLFRNDDFGKLLLRLTVGSLMLFCFGLLADQLALLRREINKH